MEVTVASTRSLARRAQFAQLLRPLKRVGAHVPFYELPCHRVPTLWTLYRGLLRAAPTEQVNLRVKTLFKTNQHLTSPTTAKKALLKGHKWLDIMQAAKRDSRLQAILVRYDSMLIARRQKDRWKEVLRAEAAWQRRLRMRPILTGAYLRPTVYNRPLPLLKPQPEPLSMILSKRRKARERRIEKVALIKAWREDLKMEGIFEEGVLVAEGMSKEATASAPDVQRCFSGYMGRDWDTRLRMNKLMTEATFIRDIRRLRTPYPPALLKAIAQARRNRANNKRHEREREKRGEVLTATIKRRNKGPPAHVLQMMTEEERWMDRMARRSVSEVGIAGSIKRRLGWRLREPDKANLEDGLPTERERLDRIEDEINEENLRRRRTPRASSETETNAV